MGIVKMQSVAKLVYVGAKIKRGPARTPKLESVEGRTGVGVRPYRIPVSTYECVMLTHQAVSWEMLTVVASTIRGWPHTQLNSIDPIKKMGRSREAVQKEGVEQKEARGQNVITVP